MSNMVRGMEQPPPEEIIVDPGDAAKLLLKVRGELKENEIRIKQAELNLALAEEAGIEQAELELVLAREAHRISSLLLIFRERKAVEQLEVEIDNSIYEMVAHLAIRGRNQILV